MRKVEIEFAKTLYGYHRMVVLVGFVDDALIAKCLSFIQRPDVFWKLGDSSEHRWNEFSKNRIFPIRQALRINIISKILGRQPKASFQWINIFEPGQFIAAHRDAAGDAHLLVPVSVPSKQFGGQFWLGHEDNLIPIGPGDALLFEASKLFHGTTPVQDRSPIPRVTFNIRLWINNQI